MKTITLHRFCSSEEFEAFARGEVLTNTTEHLACGRCSTAVGFCFFTQNPDRAIHWLSGLVDLDYCITLEAPVDAVCIARGRYGNPDTDPITSILRDEYCTTSYGKSLGFRLVSATTRFRNYCPNRRDLVRLFPSLYGQ